MEQYLNNDLQNNARTYYRNICLKVARFLSYLGKSLEPYSTQNKLLSFLTTPTSTCDKTVILHLPNDLKQVCPVFKFAVTTDNKDRDGDVATNNELYVAYVGPYQKELSDAKRFFSYMKNNNNNNNNTNNNNNNNGNNNNGNGGDSNRNNNTSSNIINNINEYNYNYSSNFNNLENIQVLVKATILKIELNYVDPLKEYLVVILDKENGEILEIFTDKGEDDRNIEPTFEDVMVSWMAVMIWCSQIVVRSVLTFRKPINRYRLSHKIYKLIKQC